MESEIWEVFKKEISVELAKTNLINYMKAPSKWSRPLSEAVKSCLNSLAKSRNETCIYSSQQNREFLVDAIICKSQGKLEDTTNIREKRGHKKPVCFPLGEITFAVEWEWDTGKDAVHFATRDVPKLKYLDATHKIIIYARVNEKEDVSRTIIKEVIDRMTIADCVTIIEFERNKEYDENRLKMNLVCSRNYASKESIGVFPIG